MVDGFAFTHDKTVLTLFSCSNYTGKCTNKGAIMQFVDVDLEKNKISQYQVGTTTGESKPETAKCCWFFPSLVSFFKDSKEILRD